jgi:hypothetical protein
MAKPITEIITIFSAETITAGSSTSVPSAGIKMYLDEGYYTIELEITGDGTCKLEYELSNSTAANCRVPEDSIPIVEGLTKTSGPNSDGKVFLEGWSPGIAAYIKIKATETGLSNSVTLTGYLARKRS